MHLKFPNAMWFSHVSELLDRIQNLTKEGGKLSELRVGNERVIIVEWSSSVPVGWDDRDMDACLEPFPGACVVGNRLDLWDDEKWFIFISLDESPHLVIWCDEIQAVESANRAREAIGRKSLQWWKWALGEDISQRVASRILHQEHVLGTAAIIDAAYICHAKEIEGSKVAYFFGVCKHKAEAIARGVNGLTNQNTDPSVGF